jgi:hypothetical protein
MSFLGKTHFPLAFAQDDGAIVEHDSHRGIPRYTYAAIDPVSGASFL